MLHVHCAYSRSGSWKECSDDSGGLAPGVSAPGFDTFRPVRSEASPPTFAASDNVIYYPWVANDGPTLGLSPADTMISIQNLSDRNAQIWIYIGDGGSGFELADTAFLSRYASKTFTAEELGIGAGEGAPVLVVGYHKLSTSFTIELV